MVIDMKHMMATSLTVPLMMIFSFLPMLSAFNDGIKKVANITYSQQVYTLINQLDGIEPVGGASLVIAVNMVLAIGFFVYAYKRSGLE